MPEYRCFKADFDTLTQKINHITKKLDKYNLKWTFNKISESVEEVEVIDYTNYNNVPSWQFTPEHKGKTPVDVVYYDFDMETLKLGEYTPIAVLEHGTVEGQQQNLIHVLDESIIIPAKYRTTKSICEHCNTDRQRNKTVLLRDANGNIKQVGTTCIKEYTGIDAADIIALYADIHDIIIDNNKLIMGYDDYINYPHNYVKTLDYLTACIDLINNKGYIKNEEQGTPTKVKAWETTLRGEQDKKYEQTAQQVIDYFKNANFDESQNFLQNIKVMLSQEYCKESGFIAYAYIAYNKQIEYENKKKAEQEHNALSDYVGNVGDKVQIELTLKNVYAYETSYNGYNTTIQHIYIFTDSNGNCYKWNTANGIEKNIGEQCKIKGSIKGHEDYKGQKQTVLTRCKVLEK